MELTRQRLTNYVVDAVGVTTSSILASRQPVSVGHLVVELSGVSTPVGVTLTSTLTSETLSFTQSDVQQTVARFTSLVGVTLSGTLAGVTLSVKVVDRDGTPLMNVSAKTIFGHLSRKTRSFPGPLPVNAPGAEEDMQLFLYTRVGEDVIPGDHIVYQEDVFQVGNMMPFYDRFTPALNHTVSSLMRVAR